MTIPSTLPLSSSFTSATETSGLLPLGLGSDLVRELVFSIGTGLVNLFTNVLVDLIAVFLFFPNPGTIGGLDQLWFMSLTAFVVIWMIAALSWIGTLQVFPYNENITAWRFIERSLIAFIAVIISRPGMEFIIQLVEMVARYVFPANFGIALTNNGIQGLVGGLTGVGVLYMVSLVILYSVSVMVILLFLGVLSMRALVVYAVYATFPIWMALWIVDEGPLKYGNMISQVAFRGFALLLVIGIFVSAILATGGAIASYEPEGGTASEFAGETDTRINPEHLNTIQEPPESGTAASEGELRNSLAMRIIALFGSLWGAFAITSSMLGMLVSVGGSAAARSSGRMQRGMPGGGANTQTDRGSPSGGGGTGGGGGGGLGGETGGATLSGAQPGSHGSGPGEDTGFVSSDDIPSQNQRSMSEQAGMAMDSAKDMVNNPGRTMNRAKGSLSTTASEAVEAPEEAMKKAGGAFIGAAKAFDSTAEMISNKKHSSVMHGLQDGADYVRENPVVGGDRTAEEMLNDHNAGFLNDNGKFKGGLDTRFESDHFFHPDSADGWEQANPSEQDVFTELDGEMYRGYKAGSGSRTMVASATDAQGEAVQMTGNAYYQIDANSNADLNTPYAEFDREAGVVVADEKQGRSLEELDARSDYKRGQLDKDAYLDQVSTGIMVGDERAAKGDVLFDKDGKAFTPNVDASGKTFSAEQMDNFADQAAVEGVATKDEIKSRVENLSNQVDSSEVADDAGHYASTDIYGRKLGKSKNKTLSKRKRNLRENMKQADDWSHGRSSGRDRRRTR